MNSFLPFLSISSSFHPTPLPSLRNKIQRGETDRESTGPSRRSVKDSKIVSGRKWNRNIASNNQKVQTSPTSWARHPRQVAASPRCPSCLLCFLWTDEDYLHFEIMYACLFVIDGDGVTWSLGGTSNCLQLRHTRTKGGNKRAAAPAVASNAPDNHQRLFSGDRKRKCIETAPRDLDWGEARAGETQVYKYQSFAVVHTYTRGRHRVELDWADNPRKVEKEAAWKTHLSRLYFCKI